MWVVLRRRYEDVSDFQTISTCQGVSLKCAQQVVCVGLTEFSEGHNKWTNGQHYHSKPPATKQRRCYQEVTDFLVTLRECYEKTTDLSSVSLASYGEVSDEEGTGKVLPWKFGITELWGVLK